MNEQNQTAVDTPQAAPNPNRVLELFLLAFLFCIVAGVSVVVTWKLRSFRTSKPQAGSVVIPPSPDQFPTFVPDFSLIDQRGQSVTLAYLRGQVWVANFFFTSCPAQCPAMNLRMGQIQRALPDGAAAKLVSITVDPEKDSPEVLAEYAATFSGKDERWLFLTGDKEAIIRLAIEGFKLSAGDDPNIHSTKLVLVDGDRRIRGYYNSTDEKSVAELQKKLLALLKAN